MQDGIIFAVIAALAVGLLEVLRRHASPYIDSLLGAVIISVVAAVIGFILLLPRLGSSLLTNQTGLVFAVVAGLAALAVDYSALKAYGAGLPVSIGGPIIIGGSIAIASIIGFALGESITVMKLAGLVLVISGSAILAGLRV